jgi:hypothetical protein
MMTNTSGAMIRLLIPEAVMHGCSQMLKNPVFGFISRRYLRGDVQKGLQTIEFV